MTFYDFIKFIQLVVTIFRHIYCLFITYKTVMSRLLGRDTSDRLRPTYWAFIHMKAGMKTELV